jgi:dihydroxy-acid dehydratase
MRAFAALIGLLVRLLTVASLFCIFLRVKALMSMLKSGLRSRDIITRKSIENSIVVVYSLGGSTNAFLHILAIAHEAEVPLTIQEIGEIGRPVPLLGNMRPHGRWHMSDLSKIGAQQA